MRESGKVTGYILNTLEDFIKPGMSTMDIDRFVEETIRKNKMIPTFKGYGGFPGSACVSINEEVVHGIPDKNRIEVYNQQTMPLVDYYKKAENIVTIDGALSLETVFAQIVESIGE